MASKLTLASIALNRSKRVSLQVQLADGLKGLLRAGAIRPGEELPGSRRLAVEFGISRNTALAAYDQLVSEGFVEARPRSGLFAAESLAGVTLPPAPEPRVPPRAMRLNRALIAPAPFRPSQPDVKLFPLALWNRLRGRALRAQGEALLRYQRRMPMGLPALQKALAAYLRDSRGVACEPEQIAIANGSQQALYLLAQVLAGQGARRAYVEDPGYPGARKAFAAARAEIVPLPVDENGLVPPARLVARSFLYTTPSRQYPTGACLPAARRLALIKAAHAAGAWIIEDDYDSEFRYSRAPLPSLHGLDSTGRVIYIGTMSKVLFPSLRIGYAVLPPDLIEPFAALRTVVDDHGPVIDQATLADFIATGAFQSHIRRCRKVYAERQSVFLEAVKPLGWPLTFPHADGGMNLAGFAEELDDRAVSQAWRAAGLDIPALSAFAVNARVSGFVFGFTAFAPAAIRQGLRQAARVWTEARR